MKRKSMMGILVVILLLTSQVTVFGKEPLTIRLTKKNNNPSKYEPSKGAYAGAYVLQDEFINKDMNKFNELTGKNHASFFKYVGYGKLSLQNG